MFPSFTIYNPIWVLELIINHHCQHFAQESSDVRGGWGQSRFLPPAKIESGSRGEKYRLSCN